MGIERGIEKKQRETDRQVSQVRMTLLVTAALQFVYLCIFYCRLSRTWMLS